MVVDREKCVRRGATMMIIITNTHDDWPAKYEPAHLGQLEHLSLLFSLSKERKVFEHKYLAKSVVNWRFCFLKAHIYIYIVYIL